MAEGVAEPLEIGMRDTQNAFVMYWANWQLVAVICPDGETAGLRLELEHQPARFQNCTVLVAEKRHQKFVLKVAPVRFPIDVEPSGVFRFRTPLQNIEPPGIVRTSHPHMIGDEVENLPQSIFPKGSGHPVERF